jgi:hypothetical protein
MSSFVSTSNTNPELPGSGSKGNRPSPRGVLGLLDQILRQRDALFEEVFEARSVASRIRSFLLVIVTLTALYGLTMGMAALVVDPGRGLLQMMASAVKLPLLYLLSVGVCFPVLFIVLVLMGARLTFSQTLALILLALTLNAVLLTSCAPMVVFFVLTGSNYHFIKLLHVAIFAFSGFWGMLALWQGLSAMCEKSDLYPRQAIRILQVWVLVFGFVGSQTAWSLRPFVGSPGMSFQIFREAQAGNFYEAVWTSVVNLGKATFSDD